MDSAETRALLRLSDGRFQSFSEAAESVLGALERTVPGTVMLGQLDSDDDVCRVIDVRGQSIDDLERGSTLPLATVIPEDDNGSAGPGRLYADAVADGHLDREFLRSLSVQASLAVPLEMSDGSIVGMLCALADQDGVYRSDHMALLGIAARLLSYEWESVKSRAELRQLRERLRDDQSTDRDTGFPNREGFVGLLDREWRLVKRGTVQSVLVACHVEAQAPQSDLSPAMTTLALKDAAAVLLGNARTTDHVGRVGDRSLAAVLVGCHGVENSQAFLRRFQSALKRTTRARPFPIAVSFGIQDLAEVDSPQRALELAENAAQLASTGASSQRIQVQRGASA